MEDELCCGRDVALYTVGERFTAFRGAFTLSVVPAGRPAMSAVKWILSTGEATPLRSVDIRAIAPWSFV